MNNSYRKIRKNRKQKGGDIFLELDELNNLGLPSNMEEPGAYNRLQDKYEQILREIPNATEDELIYTNHDINIMMTSDPDDDEDDFIPINHYHEALRPKLEDIQNKICERIDCNEHNGGKKKRNSRKRKQKGGNLFHQLDELINLAIPTSMQLPEANNKLQDKYEEIMGEIPNTNDEQLRQSYEEIYLMTTPNRDGFIPINFYDEALRYRLDDIKSKICERIDCNEHNGGKKKRKKTRRQKKRTRKRKGGNEEECSICMEQVTPNERLTTNCLHNFHRQCFINNCLAELKKGNFDAREEEDEVFQCPNCRGNTKEECLSDPEVRSIYEEKKRDYEDRKQDSDGEDYPNIIPGSRNEEFHNLKETLKSDLENTISKIHEDSAREEGEIEEFLTDLHSNLQEFDYQLGSIELQHLNEMLDDIIDEKTIDLNINLDNLKEGIKKEIEDFEEHQEGGKRRRTTRKQKGCKKKKSRRKQKGCKKKKSKRSKK
jgi:hypothetical protein